MLKLYCNIYKKITYHFLLTLLNPFDDVFFNVIAHAFRQLLSIVSITNVVANVFAFWLTHFSNIIVITL
jgi:hypothetical protein